MYVYMLNYMYPVVYGKGEMEGGEKGEGGRERGGRYMWMGCSFFLYSLNRTWQI